MDHGEGKYDDVAEKVATDTHADMVMLLVVNGNKGHGMSVVIHASEEIAKGMADGIPELLMKMAKCVKHDGSFIEMRSRKGDGPTWSDLTDEKK